MRLVRRAGIVLLAVLSACSTGLTEIAVVVDSDLSIPDQLAEISVRVDGADGLTATARSLIDPSNVVLPVNIRVATNDDDNAPVIFTVTALTRGEMDEEIPHVVRVVRTHFVDAKSLLLHVQLTSSCLNVSCEGGLTCIDGTCSDPNVDPNTLELFTGTLPDSIRDGGTDASADAGVDAAMDASVF